MILAQLQLAHDLPAWSLSAMIAGMLCGFVLGAITVLVVWLRVYRIDRAAGSGVKELHKAKLQVRSADGTRVLIRELSTPQWP